MHVKTVEHDPGFGWIARNPFTGEEILTKFRWASRGVARAVVYECRVMREHRANVQPSNG